MNIDYLKTTDFFAETFKKDSREVKTGDIFIAIKGDIHDGHDYIPEALKRGAKRIVCEHKVPGLSRCDCEKILIVPDTRTALGCIAKHIFKNPSESLLVYGVTGTNGKTTTVFLIDSILNNADIASGMVNTVFTKTREDILNRSSITTPDIFTLNQLLHDMAENSKRAAVIEVSSHALSQQRILGIGLDSAVFTNITSEHMDYHKNMRAYLAAKSKIFQNLKQNGMAVLNMDDPAVITAAPGLDPAHLVTFGKGKTAHVRAENIELSCDGTEFDMVIAKIGRVHIRTKLIGKHNVYNILAAVASLWKMTLDLDIIKRGIERAPYVPGRLEAVRTSAPFKIFVDYAHTPDALKNVLECLRSLFSGKLICVFGCGGDRDSAKRPVMGRIASSICDNVILTNDNPRTEHPYDILRQIEKGVLEKSNYSIMDERRGAIRKALESAGPGDVVLIAGKGHEDYQIKGDQILHFNDKEVAEEALAELGY